MATLYAAADATLSRFLTSDQEAEYPTAPPGTASTLQFDESTNAALIAGLSSDWQSYRLSGSTLTHNGQAVTIGAPSAAYTQRQQVTAQAQQLLSDIDAYLALSTPTNAQTVAMFQEQLRAFR